MDIVPHRSRHSPRSWITDLYLIVRLWRTTVVVGIARLLAVGVVSLKKYAAIPVLYMSDEKVNTAVVVLVRI